MSWTATASRAVTINARPGTVLPLLSSSSGQVFGAFLPASMTAQIMHNEVRANKKRGDTRLPCSQQDALALMEDVRRRGLGRVTGEMMHGIHALAAPVFDHRGHAVVAITAHRRLSPLAYWLPGDLFGAFVLSFVLLGERH